MSLDARLDPAAALQAVRTLIETIGEDPDRPGLANTPRRVVDAYLQLTSGYDEDPATYLATTFPDTSDEMVVVTGIRLVSLCEHHLLPFTGTAAVGYIPDGQVVGLSKLPRAVTALARRLQVQERLTNDIAVAIEQSLQPIGVGVVIRAHHACMGLRGAMQESAVMTTSAMRGAMLTKPEARAEFLALVRNGG